MASRGEWCGRVVVVGTGTGVGKTHVAVSLLHAIRSAGLQAVGVKPVETGVESVPVHAEDCRLGVALAIAREERHDTQGSEPPTSDPDDSTRLAEASSRGEAGDRRSPCSGLPGARVVPYRFRPPISPHLAARDAGVRIDLGAIRDWVFGHEGATVVETAGGLFSPLAPGVTNLDLANALSPCALVLVASDRIGVLHEICATVGYARALGRSMDAVVLSWPSSVDASSGTNAAELRFLGITDVVAAFPRASAASHESLRAAQALLSHLMETPAPHASSR